MLAAAFRLRRRGDFVATTRNGSRVGRGGVVVHLRLPTADEPTDRPARAGFVVSRAVGSAVVRNRVKRRLRHAVRDELSALPAGCDLVVRALATAAERSYGELASDLTAAVATAQRRARRVRSAAPTMPGQSA